MLLVMVVEAVVMAALPGQSARTLAAAQHVLFAGASSTSPVPAVVLVCRAQTAVAGWCIA